MGKLRKIGKKIKRGFKSLGKKLKKGLGKIGKAFGKLGPLGSIALSFLLPGIGNVLTGWLSNMGPVGEFILNIGSKIQKGANWVKDGVGRVFNRVTDAIEYGMNKVSSIGGQGTAGSNFRNWVSEQTKGFIDPSTQGIEDITVPGSTKTITGPDGFTKEIKVPETTISAEAQIGIGGPKVPQTPKGMVDPVYMDGIDTDLKKGFYEQADLDTYYKGANTPINKYSITDPSQIGASTDIAGANIGITGPPEPIRAIDSTGIKTSKYLEAPTPKGKGFFSKGKETYSYVAPITKAGGKILQDESDAAYADYLMKRENAQRAGLIAEETLSMVPTNTYAYAPQNFIEMNTLNDNPNGMAQMTSGYGLILEDFYS
jgi:hypothetical protein